MLRSSLCLVFVLQLILVTMSIRFNQPQLITMRSRGIAMSPSSQGNWNSEVRCNSTNSSVRSSILSGFQFAQNRLKVLWNFSRPHTIVGSCISIISIYHYAVPPAYWGSKKLWTSLISVLVPSLFMNLYITGVNQVTDVEIDKVNKPYLPIASGELSKQSGAIIVTTSLLLSLYNIQKQHWPLQVTLLGSALLGTVYSLPPFRLKRFPALAAFCILAVRGSLINMGFFLQAKIDVLDAVHILPKTIQDGTSALTALGAAAVPMMLNSFVRRITDLPTLINTAVHAYPECVPLTAFFAVFGLVIALMKDVPDIKGDVQHLIPSFAARLGAERMFRISWSLLFALLSISSNAVALSAFLTNNTTTTATTTTTTTGGVDIYPTLAITTNTTTLIARTLLSAILTGISMDMEHRASKVDTEQSAEIYDYYMYTWKIFYLCYMLLPLMRL